MKNINVEEIVDMICNKYENFNKKYLYLVDCYMHFDEHLHNVEKYSFIYAYEKIKYITYEYKELDLEKINELEFKVIGKQKEEIKEHTQETFKQFLSQEAMIVYPEFESKIKKLKNIQNF